MVTQETSLSIIFFAVFALSIILNTIFIVVVILRRRLHNGHYSLLSSLAVVDVIIVGTWATLSGVATALGWELPAEICRLQSYFLTFGQMLTAFTLATVSLERLLKMLKPSRHTLVFAPKITMFLIMSLWIFCGVISSIHLYGSVPVKWMSDQRQCVADFTESTKLLDFTFSLDHAIPYWVVALPAFLASFVKIVLARRKIQPPGEVILERNSYAPGDSYSSRLAKLQSKFAPKFTKSSEGADQAKKATLGKRVYSAQGYTEPEHWDSDIEDGSDGPPSSERDGTLQRCYPLPRPEYVMLRTAALTALITALLWLPWVVGRFLWFNTPLEPVPDWFAVFTLICMHGSSAIKPFIYVLTNVYFRSAFFKTFCCRKYSQMI